MEEKPPNEHNFVRQCKSSEKSTDDQPVEKLISSEDDVSEPLNESDKKMEKIDIISRINGNFGKWQLRTVLLIFLCKIPSSWFMACIIFTAPAPRHGEFFCRPPANVLKSEQWDNILDENKTQWIRISHPVKAEVADEEIKIDFCNVYADADKHAEHYFKHISHQHPWEIPKRNANVIPCESFVHDAEYNSLIMDYDLVCSRDILVATTQFFHLFGVLTGGLLAVNLLK